ncbi:protein kinase domain-containing protein [Actinomadura rudentiformis]|uniref:PQQ-binding-like beta-propeller repeat protein n=1 Tax=Actinomadura rudentiformis TaxID=359158 RepID=A0A6H9YR80_9ACTN|nr:PQQ-binding-like beta-propeller repeat protein [Actinomadura rudentiformis]KAB2344140.1 PQQ-binding-like beta-propeller repeat protein [Actinomadura rudentiformis]
MMPPKPLGAYECTEGPMEPLQAEDPPAFGPYQLLAKLGAGGMGKVFLGRSGSGRLVAVKVVHDSLAADPEFRARFRREVVAARAVSGAFTAPVIDAAPDAPSPWLVTGYLPGMSLQTAVDAHGPFPTDAVTALGASLAEGLAAVHRAGIVHRDLKPANVLLTPDGPRVIDFGIARATDGSAITRSGMLVGSPGYMAPEQTGERAAGPAGDVFSLGAVLTFAGTGSGPFGTGAMHAMVYRVLNEAPRLDGITDPGLQGIIVACLDKEPARRPTLDRLLQWLLNGLAEHTAPQGTWWLPAPVAADLAQRTAQIPQGPVRVAPTISGSPADGRRGPSRRQLLGIGLATASTVGLVAAWGADWLHSGKAEQGRGGQRKPSFLWKWALSRGHLNAGPIVSGGVALVVTTYEGKQTLVALDANNGQRRWEVPLPDDPTRILVRILGIDSGTGYVYTTTREILAFDPRDGKERWRLAAPAMGGGLVTGGGLLFLPGADSTTKRPGLLAVSVATGKPQWHLPTTTSLFPDPAFADGVLYFGSERRFTAVEVATRRRRWTIEGQSRTTGAPVIAGNTVYYSSERGLNAVDVTSGEVLWSVLNSGIKAMTGGWVPTVAGQKVYLASADGTLRALAATSRGSARTLWSFQTGGTRSPVNGPNPRFLAPTVAEGIACVFNGANELIGLDAETGTQKWRHTVDATDTALAMSAGNTVHLATNTGVLAIAPRSGMVVQRINGLRTSRLITANGILYFAGGPQDETLPTTVYAVRA